MSATFVQKRRKQDLDKLKIGTDKSPLGVWSVWSNEEKTGQVPDCKGLNGISVNAGNGRTDGMTLTNGHLDGSQTTSVNIQTKPNSSLNSIDAPTLTRQQSEKLSAKQMVFTWRYVIVLLLHFSFVVSTQIRNSMPMAMVCMVDTAANNRNGTFRNRTDSIFSFNHTEEDGIIRNKTTDNGPYRKEYEFSWDSELQGLILTSNSFLSFCGPLLVDVTRRRIGNKWTMTLTSLLMTIFSLLLPQAARTSPYLLVAVRVVLGIVMLANLPITGDTCAWWGPAGEKQLMISLIYAGLNVGGIICSSLAGLLCEIPYDNGWPFIFYVFGGMTLLWTIAWHLLSSQKPEEHRFVSEKEKDYIVKHRIGMHVNENVRTEKPPYKVILTSVPVLALLFVSSCHVWTSNVFFTNLPFFFVTGLQSSVLETGVIMSMVSGVRFLGIFVWTSVVNVMVRHKIAITSVRKASICTGFAIAGAAQVSIIFLDREDKWVIVGLLLGLMLNQSVGSCVIPVLPLDMAPKYAGFLTGLFFSIGTFVTISGPLLVSALTPMGTIEEWRRVWIVISVVFFMATIVFGLFGDATLQPWALEDPENETRVVSSFVQMGRRLSALFHTSPLPPNSPVHGNAFDFSRAISTAHRVQLDGQAPYKEDDPSTSRSSSMANLNDALRHLDRSEEEVDKTRADNDDDDDDDDDDDGNNRDDNSSETVSEGAVSERDVTRLNDELDNVLLNAFPRHHSDVQHEGVYRVQRVSSCGGFDFDTDNDSVQGGRLNMACDVHSEDDIVPTIVDTTLAVPDALIVTRL